MLSLYFRIHQLIDLGLGHSRLEQAQAEERHTQSQIAGKPRRHCTLPSVSAYRAI
jgi:hypothetical protein